MSAEAMSIMIKLNIYSNIQNITQTDMTNK